MPSGGSIFAQEYVKFINDEFPSSEHLFVLYKSGENDQLSKFDNICYEKEFSVSSLVQYASHTESLLLHSLALSYTDLIFLDEETTRKIVWCVWGNDLYHKKPTFISSPSTSRCLVQCVKRPFALLLYHYRKNVWKIADRKIRKFKAVVAMFNEDGEEIKRRFGNDIPIKYALYTIGYYNEDIEKIALPDKKGAIWILIGHSGYPFLKHKKYLDVLSRYKDENIKLILPLSYGNNSYIEEISGYANRLYKDKAVILKDYMSWLAYAQYLKAIDVAILDYEHQSALGNISLLLWGNSKLYLSRSGVIYKGLEKLGIKTYDCNRIKEEKFDEFCFKGDSSNKGFLYAKNTFDKNVIKEKWKDLFYSLMNQH